MSCGKSKVPAAKKPTGVQPLRIDDRFCRDIAQALRGEIKKRDFQNLPIAGTMLTQQVEHPFVVKRCDEVTQLTPPPPTHSASEELTSTHPRKGFEKLRPFEDSELVIGLIAPVGTDLEIVRETLRAQLEQAGYTVFVIRVTQQVIPKAADVAGFPDGEYGARLKALMDAGDEALQQAGDNGVIALGATKIIGGHRVWCEEDKKGEHPRRAYIISALKHPAEVETLRMIYPEGFYLIAVHEDPDNRLQRLIDKNVPKDYAETLMKRDRRDRVPHGQRVEAAFHLADFFIRVDNGKRREDQLRNSLRRIVELMFGHPFLTPTFDEYAMFMAFAASLRSADLSRQVGAVVTRDQQILSMGANDCPRFGGGLYWPQVDPETGQVKDFERGRDFTRREDANTVARREIMNEIINEAEKLTEDAGKLSEFERALEKCRIRDLTEYGRVVHAEMEALLACARIGVSTANGTLYGTTYPCHNCAKHIIAAGIKRVVFIEPYSKSKALEFHNEALKEGFRGANDETRKTLLEPFVGVGPRRFFDLFSMNLGSGTPVRRKDGNSGAVVQFELTRAKLRLQMLPHSYQEVEHEATDAFERYYRNHGGPSDEPVVDK